MSNSSHADESRIYPEMTMKELLSVYPGAQRALFRRYHIGGCSSCGFQPDETLAHLCQRNNNLNIQEVMEHVQNSHLEDLALQISPRDLQDLMKKSSIRLLDIRTREEWDAVRIQDAIFLTQEVMQELMGSWSKDDSFVIYDHMGTKSIDAAAYFAGHGFRNARCLKGGIDAWAAEVDSSLSRYEVERE